jgi:hypothetical protein
MIQVTQDLLVANPQGVPGAFSWTLASRLGEMLYTAEQRFGPRDMSYTILGVEFYVNGPAIWYPGARRHIVIQLSRSCETDPIRAYYQMAHECIHLLSPTGGNQTNVLEEGLATLFAHQYIDSQFHINYAAGSPKYDDAKQRIEALIAFDADIIRKLRANEPRFLHITRDNILNMNNGIPGNLADSLVAPF